MKAISLFSLGFIFSLFLVTTINTVFAQSKVLDDTKVYSNLETEQKLSLEKDGYYFQIDEPKYKVHTYETICKGYVEEIISDTKIEYIGHGDAADIYTYSVDVKPSKLSSTSTVSIN